MRTLVIYVESTDESDIEWLRARCLGAVQDVVDEEEGILDGVVQVGWDVQDDE